MYYAKNSPLEKAILKSFVGYSASVTQVKVSLQRNGLATQLLRINDQYECLVKLVEAMESAKYAIKEAVQQSKNLTS